MAKKTKAYIVYFLGVILLTLQATALTVQKAEITELDGASVLNLVFDEPFQVEPDTEDSETILVEFPENTNWEPASSKSSTLGLSYNYISYEDGSGDLVIKKDPRLKMGAVDQQAMNHYQISFFSKTINPSPIARPETNQIPTKIDKPVQSSGPLAITKLRVGSKNNQTRFVMDLSKQTKFIVKENPDFTKFYITPAESVKWFPALSSNQQFGLFKGYQIVKIGADISVEVSVEKGSRVSRAQILGINEGRPKLVIDIRPKGAPIPKPDTARFLKKEKDHQDPQTHITEKSPVTSLEILSNADNTILRLGTQNVENFEVRDNKTTNEVTVFLPKLDWKDVKVENQKGGLINSFRVDQTDNKNTKLILNVPKTVRVAGKKGFGKKGLARFVVYLNEGENKTPSWLISSASEDLALDDYEKEEGQVSSLVYKGGIRPYTTIGTGIYVGVKGSVVSAENKINTLKAPYTTNLLGNNFGGAAHVFAGYGLNYGKFYGGIEADIGIYGVDDKVSFTVNRTDYESSSDLKYVWGGSARLGYYITPTTLFYGRMGFVGGAFDYGATPSSTGEIIYPHNYRRDRRSGFLYGLGLESAINDTYSVRIEGAQINFQTFKHVADGDTKKDRFLLNQVSVGGAYKLSPMAGPSIVDNYDESVSTGFYFGLAGGISTLTNHRKVQGATTAPAATWYDGQSSTLDPSWSVYAGWSERFERFFFGGEIQLDLTKPIINEKLSRTNGTTTEEYSNKIRWLWALTGRAGYIFNYGTIGYGRLGFVGTQLAHRGHGGAQRSFTVAGSNNGYGLGIRAGAGIETFINKHLAIRGDYVLDFIPDIRIKDKSNNVYHEKISIINNEFKLGLSWYLDP